VTPELHRRAQELFLRAVDIPASERVEWLRLQCGDDGALEASVHDLLKHDDPRTLLSEAASQPAAARPRVIQPTTAFQTNKFTPRSLMALGALLVLVPILLCGILVDRVLDQFRDRIRADSLAELVDAKANAVQAWLAREKMVTQSWADSMKVRQLIGELESQLSTTPFNARAQTLRESPQQELLNEEMKAIAGDSVRYAVWDRQLITLADWSPERRGVGLGVTPKGAERLTEVLNGKAIPIMLGPEDSITKDYPGVPGPSRLGFLVPVRDLDENIIAVLLVYETGSEEELGRFIRHVSNTDNDHPLGGTFVFDRFGLLLFDSPYDKQLRSLGLIPDGSDSHSAKRLELRDPGVDLTRGQKPLEAFDARPLTKMVRMARRGKPGVDVSGYRDVRGVMVAGAWTWLREYEFGIGIEIDLNALEPEMWLAQLQSWALFGLMSLCLATIAYSLFALRRLRATMLAQAQIGPYVLEELVGEGGMGQVYKAHHELLKRPTAIKVLRPDLVDAATCARFQREAQLAARLEHPNTVNVFDFGISHESQFYLVMEWIEGQTLDRLINREHCVAPVRAIHLLRQIAASLREAHSVGLIHRDLKPQNVMVTQRAGEADVAKVLDFGLARDITANSNTANTARGLIAGSPHYMAPERWQPMQPINPAVDIFAFGCIAYFLLTGREAIEGDTLEQICHSALTTEPQRPSANATQSIPPLLDDLVFQCLSRDPADRPQTFDDVLQSLSQVSLSDH
jgi:eukaryotic-like serine/threonine-protein kinase